MQGSITRLNSVDSSNEEMKRLIKSGKSISNFDVISTKFQFNGKGQRGNIWESEPGLNLLFSFYFMPNDLKINDAYLLNCAVSILLVDFLTDMGVENAKIKWPNDILINEKKISGILIENSISNNLLMDSVIGVGLNVNQQEFNLNERSTSIVLETNQQYAPDVLLQDLAKHLSKIQDFLFNPKLLIQRYSTCLFGKDQARMFSINGVKVQGVIKGIDFVGNLMIQIGGEMRVFNQKEIVFLYD